MKYLFYFISITFLFSCGSGLDVEYPATYTYSKLEIESTQAFRYTDGAFVQINNDEVEEPNTSGMYGDFDELKLVDDSSLSIKDGDYLYEADYSVKGGELVFRAGNSSYAVDIIEDGNSLSFLRVGGGPFDSQNPVPYVTASCEDAGCDDLDSSGYLYGSTEGAIQYVIVFKDIYVKK